MTVSNRLTLSRIGMTFLLMWFLFIPGVAAKIMALLVFILACFTDFLDGWLARKRREVSDFGKIMDPLADKILVLAVFLSFVELRIVPAWMVMLIIVREFLITGIRLFSIRKGTVMAAESAGKHKTVSQMVTIFFILVFIIMRESVAGPIQGNAVVHDWFRVNILLLMSITVVLTLYSGLTFVWQNRKLIKSL